MTKDKDIVNFRVTKQEKEILQEYCELTGRTQTDVYREFIRDLSKRLLKLRVSNP
ncbi:TOBE domain protein [Scytonema sp. HK-05]|nr:TOBE domain protein [Scytonema sp. HK-05]